jgi:hypothetical protein
LQVPILITEHEWRGARGVDADTNRTGTPARFAVGISAHGALGRVVEGDMEVGGEPAVIGGLYLKRVI